MSFVRSVRFPFFVRLRLARFARAEEKHCFCSGARGDISLRYTRLACQFFHRRSDRSSVWLRFKHRINHRFLIKSAESSVSLQLRRRARSYPPLTSAHNTEWAKNDSIPLKMFPLRAVADPLDPKTV